MALNSINFFPKKLENVSEDEASIIMIDSNGAIDEKNEPLQRKPGDIAFTITMTIRNGHGILKSR